MNLFYEMQPSDVGFDEWLKAITSCPYNNTVKDEYGTHHDCGDTDDNGDPLLCGQCLNETADVDETL